MYVCMYVCVHEYMEQRNTHAKTSRQPRTPLHLKPWKPRYPLNPSCVSPLPLIEARSEDDNLGRKRGPGFQGMELSFKDISRFTGKSNSARLSCACTDTRKDNTPTNPNPSKKQNPVRLRTAAKKVQPEETRTDD